LLALGALVMSAAQVWEAETGFVAWPGAAAFAAGSALFAAAVWRVRAPFPLRLNPQPLYLRAAAVWLVVAAALSAWSTAESEVGVIPLDLSRATLEVFLRGFVMLTIVGIGLRAFVGHLNLEPLTPRRQAIALAGLNASLVAWLAGQGLGPFSPSEALSRLGDAGYGATILVLTAWFGLMPRMWSRTRTTKYELLIPAAWIGAIAYAALLIAAATLGGTASMTLYEEGAIRHTFMLGLMIPLMVGMAHVVLARFGTGAVPGERALTLAFWLLVAAWPMRVGPVLWQDAPSTAGEGFMALAGGLAMVGLAMVAAVCARTALGIVRRHRHATPARMPLHVVRG
jgi:hypothetical protein